MMPRKFELSAYLTDVELGIVERVQKAENLPEDPETVMMNLTQTIERLAKRIHHMREQEEDAAQSIMDHLALQPSTAEYDHGLNVLKGVADDLFFDVTS